MSTNRLSAYPAPGPRTKALEEGRKAQQAISAYERRTGEAAPPYELLELIGQGAYGRVYKAKSLESNKVVAVKIISFDDEDIEQNYKDQNSNLRDIQNEIRNLASLRNSGAKNINTIYEALSYQADIWIISEYCPGGSLNTLMKPFGGSGLPEKYIRVIARELAIALECVHSANVLHRDLKAGNVLVTQAGQLQLCDFGVSAICDDADTQTKRTTMIGTPHWMAPEMLRGDFTARVVTEGYDLAVDIWAYGCTIYELATGSPPLQTIDLHNLSAAHDKQGPPRLDPEKFSKALCDFVAFCLEADPLQRPNAAAVAKADFVTQSCDEYPTALLKELINKFSQWEAQGGNRASLFAKAGVGDDAYEIEHPDDDWNFSEEHDEEAAALAQTRRGMFVTDYDRERHELRTKDVADNFNRLFDPSFDPEAAEHAQGYEFKDPPPKEPKRLVGGPQTGPPPTAPSEGSGSGNRRSEVKSVMIDLDELMGAESPPTTYQAVQPQDSFPSFSLDAPANDEPDEWQPQEQTVKRATMAWTFADAAPPVPTPSNEKRETLAWSFADAQSQPQTAKRSTMAWTFAAASEPSPEATDLTVAPAQSSSFKFPPSPTAEISGYDTDFHSETGPGSDTEADEGSPAVSEGASARALHMAEPAYQPAASPPKSIDETESADAEVTRQVTEMFQGLLAAKAANQQKLAATWSKERAKRVGRVLRWSKR